jgi:hypothetical protein
VEIRNGDRELGKVLEVEVQQEQVGEDWNQALYVYKTKDPGGSQTPQASITTSVTPYVPQDSLIPCPFTTAPTSEHLGLWVGAMASFYLTTLRGLADVES